VGFDEYSRISAFILKRIRHFITMKSHAVRDIPVCASVSRHRMNMFDIIIGGRHEN